MENQENKLIQLTESDLHDIVNGAVQEILVQEGFRSNLKGAFKPMGQVAKQVGQKMGSGIAQAAKNVGNKVGQMAQNVGDKVGDAATKVGQTVQSGANTMRAGWQNAKLQGLKDDTIKALQNYVAYASKTVGAGDPTIQAVNNAIAALRKNASLGNARVGAYRNQFASNLGMKK